MTVMWEKGKSVVHWRRHINRGRMSSQETNYSALSLFCSTDLIAADPSSILLTAIELNLVINKCPHPCFV